MSHCDTAPLKQMRFFLQVVGEEFCDYIRKKRDPTTQGKKRLYLKMHLHKHENAYN
jgi:hypothetical protein